MSKQRIFVESTELARISIRLLSDSVDCARFDELVEEQHYLKSAHLAGQTLRYVAELDGVWVALFSFGAASLHLKARDKLIGWSARQRVRRLGLIVNNNRFCLLTDRGRLPNLASRALGLVLRRLSDDWLERWGHPVLAVESFVDESRYPGTAYKACGFQALGATAGFGRHARDFYTFHGEPKALYFRELHPRAVALLRQARWPKELLPYEAAISGPCPIRVDGLHSLWERFRTLPDSRRGHGLRHPQAAVLACAATAVLLGAGGYEAMADTCAKFSQPQLRALGCRLNLTTGRYAAPSDSTFLRVLHRVDAADFERLIGEWLMAQEASELEQLAVDGKVLRGSGRTDGKPLQLLSAVTHRLRLTLGQVPIEAKSNEIPALLPLLRTLAPPPGTLITADALHCQQDSARFITQELGGDYLFGLKGNQSGILETAETLLKRQGFPPCGSQGMGEGTRAAGTEDGGVVARHPGTSGAGGLPSVSGHPA